jgi:hypothetical protein
MMKNLIGASEKMRAVSLADLVRLAEKAGIGT